MAELRPVSRKRKPITAGGLGDLADVLALSAEEWSDTIGSAPTRQAHDDSRIRATRGQ